MSDRTFFLNNYVHVNGLLQKLNPVSKFISLVIFTISIFISSKYVMFIFIFDIVFYFILFILSGIKPAIILRQYLFAFTIFSLFFVFNYFFIGQDSAYEFQFRFLIYLINLYLLFNLFIWTTDIGILTGYLERAGFPKTIATLILLIYRIIFILLSEVSLLSVVLRLRLKNRKLGFFRKMKVIISNIFERSFTRIERFTAGALTRGFNGRFMTVKEFSWNLRDTLTLILVILICSVKVMINYA